MQLPKDSAKLLYAVRYVDQCTHCIVYVVRAMEREPEAEHLRVVHHFIYSKRQVLVIIHIQNSGHTLVHSMRNYLLLQNYTFTNT